MQKLNLPGAKILSLSECALSQLSYCLEQVQKLHRPPAIVHHGLVPRSWELVQEKGPVKYYINICYYNINRIPCLTSLFEEWQYNSHDISVHLTIYVLSSLSRYFRAMEQLHENLHERRLLLTRANEAVLAFTDDLLIHIEQNQRLSDAMRKFQHTAKNVGNFSGSKLNTDDWHWLLASMNVTKK